MNGLRISDTRDYFIQDGKPFFFLADTVWMAFSNPSLEEWEEYLDYRRMQGFNAVQICVPTLICGGAPDTGLYSFELDASGKLDLSRINTVYFERAAKMLEMAVEKGFVPVLVVLWSDYVKGTWSNQRWPDNTMPLEAVKPYAEYIVRLFAPYRPVYIACGDTDLRSGEARQYYKIILDTIKTITPDALTTIHLGGPGYATQLDVPDEIMYSEQYDFYMFQSGHVSKEQQFTHILPKGFYDKPVKRPIVNGEPCYEGHSFLDTFGRYNEFYVRRAVWHCILSGGKAGITYGAHGIWGWHRKTKVFEDENIGGKPLAWRDALQFKGAWDAGFAKHIVETYSLFDIEPKEAILNNTPEIRMAVSKDSDRIVIYAPHNTDIEVNMDLSRYDWTLINLSDRIYTKPVVQCGAEKSVIKIHPFNSDVLLIGRK